MSGSSEDKYYQNWADNIISAYNSASGLSNYTNGIDYWGWGSTYTTILFYGDNTTAYSNFCSYVNANKSSLSTTEYTISSCSKMSYCATADKVCIEITYKS